MRSDERVETSGTEREAQGYNSTENERDDLRERDGRGDRAENDNRDRSGDAQGDRCEQLHRRLIGRAIERNEEGSSHPCECEVLRQARPTCKSTAACALTRDCDDPGRADQGDPRR